MGKFVDFTGKRFGKLGVIKKVGKSKYGQSIWLCRCDCGKEKEINSNDFRSGQTVSCGCHKIEMLVKLKKIEFGLNSKRQTFNSYKQAAKNKKFIFELSFDEFINLTQQKCYYCGSEPNNVKKSQYNNGDFIYNGIDRIDNNRGYTLRNVVPCCGICNYMKRSLSQTCFIEHVKKIVDYRRE